MTFIRDAGKFFVLKSAKKMGDRGDERDDETTSETKSETTRLSG